MRRVHCTKCWQLTPLLTRRCVHCGDIDRHRFGQGLTELLIYVACGASAIGLAVWCAITVF
jgi:hypothetical protein